VKAIQEKIIRKNHANELSLFLAPKEIEPY